MERRLAAILAADVVGFQAMARSNPCDDALVVHARSRSQNTLALFNR